MEEYNTVSKDSEHPSEETFRCSIQRMRLVCYKEAVDDDAAGARVVDSRS